MNTPITPIPTYEQAIAKLRAKTFAREIAHKYHDAFVELARIERYQQSYWYFPGP